MEKFQYADQDDDFKYTINGNSVTIVKYTGSGGDLELPSIFNHHPVTRIGSRSFSFCARLTAISIPDCISSIDEWAFHSCIELSAVRIPSSVTSIGNFAFARCFKLANITIPASIINIGQNAFQGCAILSAIDVNVKNSVYRSEDGVLFDKTGTTLIKCPEGKKGIYSIPESVTEVWPEAFSQCNGLTSITIHANVTRIGSAAFDRCAGLTDISVDRMNPEFSSADGVLFNKGQTVLCQCPAGRFGNYAIAEGVTRIADGAFSDCAALTQVTFPNSVISIGRGAFSGCQSLTHIEIPDSITSIDHYAFFRCDHLIPSGGRGLEQAVGKLVWLPLP